MQIRIGEKMVQKGYVSAKDVMNCLDIQKKEGGTLGIIMLNMGLITEIQLVETLQDKNYASF